MSEQPAELDHPGYAVQRRAYRPSHWSGGGAGIHRDWELPLTNRIRAIHGSHTTEGNRLSDAQVSAILDDRHVVASLREIQEPRNAMYHLDGEGRRG